MSGPAWPWLQRRSAWLSGHDTHLAHPAAFAGTHAVDLHLQTIARANHVGTERRQPVRLQLAPRRGGVFRSGRYFLKGKNFETAAARSRRVS